MGTGRHFFGEMADIVSKSESDSILSTYLKSLYFQLKGRVTAKDKLDLKKIVETHDKGNSGKIRKLDMLYILVEKFDTPNKEADIILKNLPSDNSLMHYQPLLDKLQ